MVGTFGTTKDGLPYIGEHKDFLNSYFVLGFGGNGITFSVVGMEMVSSWLKGENINLQNGLNLGDKIKSIKNLIVCCTIKASKRLLKP